MGMGVSADVALRKVELTVFGNGVAILQVDATLAGRFDLSPQEYQARFDAVQHLIVMTSLAILSD
jgi:hypothetical protein